MKTNCIAWLSCFIGSTVTNIFQTVRLIAFSAVLLAVVATAHAQQNIFIKFTPSQTGGIPVLGDSPDAVYSGSNGWFVVSQFSLGATNGGAIGSATGGSGSAHTKFMESSLEKVVNVSSVGLFRALAVGAHYDAVQLVVRKPGTQGNQAYLTFDFKLGIISGQFFTAASSDTNVNEDCRMVYGSIRITIRPINSDGSLGSPVIGQWSQVTNDDDF